MARGGGWDSVSVGWLCKTGFRQPPSRSLPCRWGLRPRKTELLLDLPTGLTGASYSGMAELSWRRSGLIEPSYSGRKQLSWPSTGLTGASYSGRKEKPLLGRGHAVAHCHGLGG
jgi:hypothetical protein